MKSLLTITAAIMLLISCTKKETVPTVSNAIYTLHIKYKFDYQYPYLKFKADTDTTLQGVKVICNFSYDWYCDDTLMYRYHWLNSQMPSSTENTLSKNYKICVIKNITIDSVWVEKNDYGYKINLVY
ncbi:hypothetical protein UFOVP129_43 [uncultured Caudovirales phage]|uniref:Lipoprotein n=1 Tax=uncultured Caudovirales phage TaxID=2100421 RepID=A0A6J5LAI6_9CAUD|nr:hypothetical protein UFOVP129_43 [uncultured Caudovirales phage]